MSLLQPGVIKPDKSRQMFPQENLSASAPEICFREVYDLVGAAVHDCLDHVEREAFAISRVIEGDGWPLMKAAIVSTSLRD